jgi:regulator of sirC expression with transglutaminase-like and TPR domain
MIGHSLAHPARSAYLRAMLPPAPDILEAVLCIAWEDQDSDRRSMVRLMLDDMAEALSTQIESAETLLDHIAAISSYFFDELGFHGNESNYNAVANSYLDQVLLNRTGLPITLSLLYIALARRCGLAFHGVALPGHFMVQFRPRNADPIIIDPFRNGKRWSMSEVASYLHRNGQHTNVQEWLVPPTPEQVVVRVLRNLKGSLVMHGNYRAAANAIERILVVVPSSAQDVRDYGLILSRLNLPAQSIAYLERYAHLAPDAADLQSIRHHVKTVLGKVDN